MNTVTRMSRTIVASAVVAFALPALAAPPGHAPAHGYRAKQKQKVQVAVVHVGRSGYEWELDYGIQSGNCDRRAIASALGGITGAVIANRVAERENRLVATLIGAAAGALIGNRIGRNFDKADEACLGHALELGNSGQPVHWVNETTGVSYQVVPGADRSRDGSTCREFNFTAVSGSQQSSRRSLACQTEPGVWQMVQ
jgi:surface antigen